MIYVFTTGPHRYIARPLERDVAVPLRVRSYDWLFRQTRLSARAVIFTDVDRLRHFELAWAARLCRLMREAGLSVLNDPARVAQREELLHRLHKAGINRHRAWRAVLDPAPERFPVFLKCTMGHHQDLDELIPDQAALEARLEALRADGFPLTHMLVIEFANDPVRPELYIRRSAYRVGDAVITGSPMIQRSPFVKSGTAGVSTDEDRAEAIHEMDGNVHADALGPVFDLGGIEYGRADFGFTGGRLAVYEINTNPYMGFSTLSPTPAVREAQERMAGRIHAAMAALQGEERTVTLAKPLRWLFHFEPTVPPRPRMP